MPKVSVVMPAYNAEKYIREAIDSVLAQTFTDFEFIILDDGSTDATAAIIQSYEDDRIRFCPNERNMGVAATLNRGLKLAQGEYIARMDADDVSFPERFEKQITCLDLNRDIAVLGTGIESFCDAGMLSVYLCSCEPEKLKEDLFFSCGIAHPSVMMRRDAILALGGYDETYNGLEDYELWFRVAERYEISTLPEVLFRYRMHGGQVTKNPSPQFMERIRRLKQRQADRISVTATRAEFDAYVAYCTDMLSKSYDEIAALGRFFEKAAAGNERAGYYRQDYLKADFRSVMLHMAAELPMDERKPLCAESGLISFRELRWMSVKSSVKRLIGRESL